MSMSEFEESQDADTEQHQFSAGKSPFPADFSMDDVAFACELSSLFAPEQEEMPPLFVQTLLEADDSRYQPSDDDLELKIRARVFRRLKLKRRLFQEQRPPLRKVLTGFPSFFSSLSRPLAMLAFSCLLIVCISMALAGPSFASGLNYLWTGTHSGVLQVDAFPPIFSSTKKPHTTKPQSSSTHTKGAERQLTIASAQAMLSFNMAVPFALPENYTQHDYYLYDGDPNWANGPIMVLDYTHALPGVAPSHITICEFKPQGDVLQVAQDNAAHQLRIEHGAANGSIVYVEGQWSSLDNSAYTWNYSNRSQVIFELNGVEIWIVGDKRDGIGQDQLLQIAASLKAYNPAYTHGINQLDRVFQSDENTPDVFNGDVIYLDNPNNPEGPSFKLIGTPSNSVSHTVHEGFLGS